MLQEIINALQRIFLAHDVQDDTVIISVLVPGAQQAEESAVHFQKQSSIMVNETYSLILHWLIYSRTIDLSHSSMIKTT